MASNSAKVTIYRPYSASTRRHLLEDHPRLGIHMMSDNSSVSSVITLPALEAFAPFSPNFLRNDVLYLPTHVTSTLAVTTLMSWVREACVQSPCTSHHLIPENMTVAIGIYDLLGIFGMSHQQIIVHDTIVTRLKDRLLTVDEVKELWDKASYLTASLKLQDALIDNLIHVFNTKWGQRLHNDPTVNQMMKEYRAWVKRDSVFFHRYRARHHELSASIAPVFEKLLDRTMDTEGNRMRFEAWLIDQCHQWIWNNPGPWVAPDITPGY